VMCYGDKYININIFYNFTSNNLFSSHIRTKTERSSKKQSVHYQQYLLFRVCFAPAILSSVCNYNYYMMITFVKYSKSVCQIFQSSVLFFLEVYYCAILGSQCVIHGTRAAY